MKVVKDAGKAIMQIYDQDFELEYKKDDSPLIFADKEAHNIIETVLNRLKVRLPILPEEGKEIPVNTKNRYKMYKIVVSRSHMSNETQKFIDAIVTDKKKKLVSIGSPQNLFSC